MEFQGHRAANHLDQPLGQVFVKRPLDRPAIERQLAALPTQNLDPLAQPVAALADDRLDDLEEAGQPMPARLLGRGGRGESEPGKGPVQFEQPVRGGQGAVPDGLDRLTEQPPQVVLVHRVGRETSGEVAVRREGVLISPASQTSLGATGVDGDGEIPGRLPVLAQGREALGQRERAVPRGVVGV